MYKLNAIFTVKIAIVTSALLPVAYLIYMAIVHSVNVPSYDEWYYIPMFEKMFTGTLTFNDLWVTVNEHRLLVPKLILLLSVRLTHWNLDYLVALNIIFGVGAFLILVGFLVREKKIFPYQYSIYVLPLISLLFFSLVQYENWLWGLQTLIFINELAVLVGFYNLTGDKLTYKNLAFSFLAGLFATLSHLAGLLFWPVCFSIIIFNPKIHRSKKMRFALIWVFASVVVFIAYFVNYSNSLQTAQSLPTISSQRMQEILILFLAILGSPFELYNRNLQILLGSVGLAVFTAHYILGLEARKFTNFHLFLLAVASYGLISSVMTAVGRISYEPPYIPSRYSSFSILFWIAFVFLIFFLLTVKIHRAPFVRIVGIFFFVLMFFFSINGSKQGSIRAGLRSKRLKTALHGFLSSPFPENINQISTIYPRMNVKDGQYIVYLPHVVQKLDILSKYRLSFFYEYLK